MKVYLCGPINGCTDAECKDWREFAKANLVHDTLDPMRRDYRGKEEECHREIVELDKIDVRASGVILVNRPVASDGTPMELFYAWEIGKPTVVVVPEGVRLSPWIRYHATKLCTTMREAIDWIHLITNVEKPASPAEKAADEAGDERYAAMWAHCS